MQRLFSVFPSGLPGVGLLLLRLSVAILLLYDHYGHQQELSAWMLPAALLLAVALLAGFLTPFVAVMGLVSHVVIWVTAATYNPPIAAAMSFNLIALALIGPGEFSVDSRLFGRRVVVLPPP